MKKLIAVSGALLLIVSAIVATGQTQRGNEVPYPEGYRDWTHVKSMVLLPGHDLYADFGGIHHVYANDKALAALKAGKPYPDGAVFVFDLLAHTGDSTAITEGERKVVGVMWRDAARYAKTGNWGFEGFAGNTRQRVVTDGGSACYSCHSDQASATGYVFSKWRD